jgi:hypothetical protein
MRSKLSFANVVSVLALFVALGGSAYAFHLGKNSVGSKQLKLNAVTTAKIKEEAVTGAKIAKGTITGTQVNVSTLGTVPAAQTAQTAQSAQTAETANTVAAPEPWHFIGALGEPQFQHGCKNEPNLTVGFYKDHEGVVHLQGSYLECVPEGEVAFQLPSGYRPGFIEGFGSAEARPVEVFPTEGNQATSGAVACFSPLCNLNGITFRAES